MRNENKTNRKGEAMKTALSNKQCLSWLDENGVASRAVSYIRDGSSVNDAVKQAFADHLGIMEEMVAASTDRAKKTYDRLRKVTFVAAHLQPEGMES